MEQHPVPRNISGFQFHLIGDMTLRQFGYLAAGVGIGYLVYKSAPFTTIINIPLALSCGFAGFAFAFLPIQERPLEKWLAAFIKSIMSPTQYLWYKNNPAPDILTRTYALHIQTIGPREQTASHKETNEKLRAYLATVPVPIHESLNAAEKRYIDKTLALFQTSATAAGSPYTPPNPPPTVTPHPSRQIVNKTPQETQVIPEPPIPVPAVQPKSQDTKPPKEENHLMQKQLTQLAAEKAALEKELQKLQQQLTNVGPPPKIEPSIKVVSPKSAQAEVGMLNYQQAPNLIAGVIKDPQKKLLPNIILTIKDKSGLPVRALKTNKLGQFSTATPLPNGTYLLEVEDPMKRYVFDVAQISLSGKVFLPIEIIAKGEKELMREKLTKELFGTSPM